MQEVSNPLMPSLDVRFNESVIVSHAWFKEWLKFPMAVQPSYSILKVLRITFDVIINYDFLSSHPILTIPTMRFYTPIKAPTNFESVSIEV